MSREREREREKERENDFNTIYRGAHVDFSTQ